MAAVSPRTSPARRRARRRRAAFPVTVAALAVGSVAAACGGDNKGSTATTAAPTSAAATTATTTSASTTAPASSTSLAPTTTAATGSLPVDDLRAAVKDTMAQLLVPAAVVTVSSPSGTWTEAFGTRSYGGGDAVTTDDTFRIGSTHTALPAITSAALPDPHPHGYMFGDERQHARDGRPPRRPAGGGQGGDAQAERPHQPQPLVGGSGRRRVLDRR